MLAELISSFDRTVKYVHDLAADLSDEELTLQPPGVPNHAIWTLGHLTYSCQEMARELGVDPWLPDDWGSLFGCGSSPTAAAASSYSSRDVVTARFVEAAARLREALSTADESRLDDPLPDVDSRKVLPTIGEALLQIVASHSAYHAGQLACWRRAIGREPVGVFI